MFHFTLKIFNWIQIRWLSWSFSNRNSIANLYVWGNYFFETPNHSASYLLHVVAWRSGDTEIDSCHYKFQVRWIEDSFSSKLKNTFWVIMNQKMKVLGSAIALYVILSLSRRQRINFSMQLSIFEKTIFSFIKL